MARTFRRAAVALPITGVLFVAAAGPAVATSGSDPPGNPHASGVTGNPHADHGGGKPHGTTPDPAPPAPSEPAPAPAPTTGPAPAPTSSSAPSVEDTSTFVPISVASASVAAAKPTGSNGHGGKPCDGCVGNADGKQPPGQEKNGEKGHRCDDNKGIGKGNPAHKGCETTTGTTTTTTTPTTTTTTDDTTTDTTTSDTTDDTAVLGEEITRSGAKVLGVTLTRGALARTGTTGDPLDLTVVALGLVLAGRVLVARARRV